MHILVVDDEPDLRLILQLNLQRWGHEVTTAASAAEAEEVLRRSSSEGAQPPVAAMLVDVSMPGETGLELLERLGPTGLLPSQVAVLSAMVVGDAMPAGPDVAFLAKPFGVDDLQALVTGMAAAVDGA